MYRKIFTLLFAISISVFAAKAQPTTEESSVDNAIDKKRAQAGDFGIYIGLSSDMFKGWFDFDLYVTTMPLVNLKYMVSDHYEVRLGAEFYKHKTKDDKYKVEGDEIEDDTSSELKSKTYFYPGFAYHFIPQNIFDIYVGAELPIGWSKKGEGCSCSDISYSSTRSSMDMGLGAFVGMQTYLGRLPITVGFEYEISTIFHLGTKYKTELEDEFGNKTTYQTEDLIENPNYQGVGFGYDSLKAKQGELGQQFRITLAYYF